ncbi:MAG: DUF2232 domain-containing protein [Roseiarcus sp.]|jgi:hypothetical protein
MMNRIGVPVGAGLSSALLFVVTVKGTAIAMALAYLAPLPIMIAALGWGALSGALACIAACACVAAVVEPLSGLLFALTIALPAWGLASFASLPESRLPWRRRAPPSEWMSVGAIVTLAAVLGALISLAALVALIVVYGGYDKGLQAFADALQPAIEEATGGAAGLLPEGETANEFALSVVRLSPAAIAGSTLLMFCVNLYAAARSAALSRRLPRPWPDIPSSLVLPAPMAALALASLAPAFALPAPANQYAWIVAGALGAAFVLQGLAVLHALSRGLPMRPWLLAALYFCCFIRSNWTLPAIAIVGLLESFASLRARAAASKSKI